MSEEINKEIENEKSKEIDKLVKNLSGDFQTQLRYLLSHKVEVFANYKDAWEALETKIESLEDTLNANAEYDEENKYSISEIRNEGFLEGLKVVKDWINEIHKIYITCK